METDKKKLIQIDQFLEKLGGIPPIPAVARKVLRLAGSDDARLADIARLIATDQGLATQILRMCNSAYYGIPHRVKSLSRAVALLGFKSVRNLVVIHSLPRRRSGTPTFAEAAIWTHSTAGAIVARLLALETQAADPEEAMLGGLIHDTGRLVLNMLIPDHYEPVMRAIYNREGPSVEIEREAMGIDHTTVGEAVLRKWNFPDELVDTVRRHHDASDTLDPLTLIVQAANEELWILGMGVREPAEPVTELPPALGRLGYSLEELPELEERMRAAMESGKEFFGQV
ncbi:MAG: HDOD domain-containing protein [Candidatus Eisenbacteria sp.]|nr:HDOD domain-containing protein [Candidatus Eisenbacteria bacterium]